MQEKEVQANEDGNEDDEAVVEDEESEFNHFEDEEEFEGYSDKFYVIIRPINLNDIIFPFDGSSTISMKK